MNSALKQKLFKSFVVLLNIAIIGIYIFSLIVMTSDAQGIFIFFVAIPVIVVLGAIAVLLSRKISISRNYFLKFSQFVLFGLFLFSISGLIPILDIIPKTSVDFLISSFTEVTGKTPRQYFSDRNNLEKLIQAELNTSSGTQINFSKINTAHSWNRLCIFTPYTSDLVADQLVGQSFSLSTYSEISSSDSIHVIALFDDKSLVKYLNMKRSVIDFDLKDSVCVPRTNAILYKQNGKFKF